LLRYHENVNESDERDDAVNVSVSPRQNIVGRLNDNEKTGVSAIKTLIGFEKLSQLKLFFDLKR
jgi:hypothetical protein